MRGGDAFGVGRCRGPQAWIGLDLLDLPFEVRVVAAVGMPAAFSVCPDALRAKVSVVAQGCGPSLPRELWAVGGHRQPVIGDEVDELCLVVEGEDCADGVVSQ
jgi:hypothetical protein